MKDKKMYGHGGRTKAMYGGMKKMNKGGIATAMKTAEPT